MAAITMKSVPSFSDIAGRLKRAEQGIRRANIKSVKGATLAGQRFARRIAPVKTGELKEGIIRKPIVRKGKTIGSALISKVNKPFPYQKWVNEDIKTVRLPTTPQWSHERRTRGGRSYVYRKRPSAPRAYRSTRHTGVPGYFNLTAIYLAKKFPQLALTELNRELKIAMKS